jgi:hypothetical protein
MPSISTDLDARFSRLTSLVLDKENPAVVVFQWLPEAASAGYQENCEWMRDKPAFASHKFP